MKPIFITGYMGCGKTTFGRALAEKTGLRFIDLDHYIEERCGATVTEIFASRGEDGFRETERQMLHEAAQGEDVVISCGGGTPCFFDNIDFMNACGVTVWLKATEECLLSRLCRKREKRPLIAGRSDEEIRSIIGKQLESRAPYYSRSQIVWQGDSLEDRRQIDENIAGFCREFPHLLPC